MPSETFDAAWLALREPVDHRSRSRSLLGPLVHAWKDRSWCRVLDLGSGTGSNIRYLVPSLPGAQSWTLLDHDAQLLKQAESPARDVDVRRVQGDLDEVGLAAVGDAHLVTASALLDLVSEAWLQRLAEACRSSFAGALFALTYDGRMSWSPEDPNDALVAELVNAHQRGDKGLGPALGPMAGPTADRLFRRMGYRTWLEPSPWRLGPDDADLVTSLVDGWGQAAAAMGRGPDEVARVHAWAERRRRTIASAAFRVTVGHVDLLALP